MTLNCKRCGHIWDTRTEKEPKVCPACKSKLWKDKIDLPKSLMKRCDNIIKISSNVDYITIAPQLLQLVMVAFSEAEKEFEKRTYGFDNAKKAIDILNVIKELVVNGLLPDEIYSICSRLSENYFRDSNPIDCFDFSEKQMAGYVISNWNDSGLCSFEFIKNEYVLETLGRIDILAKEKNTGRDVIIELKKGCGDGYKQLFTYATRFDNPILINISTEKPNISRDGIRYIVLDEKKIKAW